GDESHFTSIAYRKCQEPGGGVFVAESHFTCSKSVSIISRCCNTPILWCAAHFSRSSTLGPLCRLLFTVIRPPCKMTTSSPWVRSSVSPFAHTRIRKSCTAIPRANGAAPPTKKTLTASNGLQQDWPN